MTESIVVVGVASARNKRTTSAPHAYLVLG